MKRLYGAREKVNNESSVHENVNTCTALAKSVTYIKHAPVTGGELKNFAVQLREVCIPTSVILFFFRQCHYCYSGFRGVGMRGNK